MGLVEEIREDNCALCGKKSKLEESHIIPKFVFRHLKKDSFTGKLRVFSNPNVPQQDGDKQPLLCGECEDLFSRNETHFANKVYYPFNHNGFNGLTYEGWLHYFITSVNWRNLYLDIIEFEKAEDDENKIDTKQLSVLKKSEEIMRSYLLGKQRDIGQIENHIFFYDKIESADDKTASINPYSLIHGSAFGYTLLDHQSQAISVFSNLTGIIIVTVLRKHPKERWKNTFVKVEPGKIKLPQMTNSSVFGEIHYLENQRKEMFNAMNENQINKILDKVKKNPEGFKSSGSYKRLIEDGKIKIIKD